MRDGRKKKVNGAISLSHMIQKIEILFQKLRYVKFGSQVCKIRKNKLFLEIMINPKLLALLIMLVFNHASIKSQTKLLNAIHKNDSLEVDRLLKSGLNANSRKLFVRITLPKRIKHPRFEQERKRKFSFHIFNSSTALSEAAYLNRTSIARTLLAYGAKPNKKSRNVLMPVCCCGNWRSGFC